MKKLPTKIVAAVVAVLAAFAIIELTVQPQHKAKEKKHKPLKAAGTVTTNTGNLQTFASALKTADLVDSLNAGGPYTIFAPTDSAFSSLPAGAYARLVAAENKKQLKKVLRHHIVKRAVQPGQMRDSLRLETAAGDSLLITLQNDSTFVDGAPITAAKISASNGAIYRIAKVLTTKEHR